MHVILKKILIKKEIVVFIIIQSNAIYKKIKKI